MDVSQAEKKLRQARFFLGKLEQASTESIRDERDREHVEFYFSACLTAAQSVYYVLNETGGRTFREIQRRWRAQLADEVRFRFERTIGLRDNDVHLGSTAAESLPKYVKEDPKRYRFFGSPAFDPGAVLEEENPDGRKVSGPVLRGAVGLYIEQLGRCHEVTDVCREFITQLGSLVVEMRAANGPEETAESKA